jgi:hypothetical protein
VKSDVVVSPDCAAIVNKENQYIILIKCENLEKKSNKHLRVAVVVVEFPSSKNEGRLFIRIIKYKII